MKNSRNPSLIGLFSIRHVAVSVVIVYCKTDHYRQASHIMSGKLCIANEAVGCIWCMLNEESSVFVNWIDTHFPVTWTDQYGIFLVNRAFLSFYFSGKEIIIGIKFLFFIFVQIDPVGSGK